MMQAQNGEIQFDAYNVGSCSWILLIYQEFRSINALEVLPLSWSRFIE